jgi:hypothetical protein
MKSRTRVSKKNRVGFTEEHLTLLLIYCAATKENPKTPITVLHKNISPYSRKKSTADLIDKAYKREVITGPELFVNSGIEVSLIRDIKNPRKFFSNCKEDKRTTMALALHGYWSIFWCKRGASTLQHYDSVLPTSSLVSKKSRKLCHEIKGKLSTDPYPNGWCDTHWKIYCSMKFPREKTFRDVGKELEFSWVTARKYFLEVLQQSKVIINFFPLGLEAYSPLFVTFKTDYEIGISKGLKNLDRTTYLYKADNTVMLLLCIGPEPRSQNHFTEKFVELEETGLISDLHISTPFDWYKAF